MAGLPDMYFWDEPVNSIPTRVTAITLATISTYSGAELLRIGWYLRDANGNIFLNPAIDLLYTLTSAGVWIARTNASGLIAEAYSGSINSYATIGAHQAAHPTIAPAITDSTVASYAHRRIAVKPFVLTNGVYADGELVAAVAGFYGVIRILGVYCSAAVDGNDMTLAFEDSDNTDLSGAPPSITAAVLPTAFTDDLAGLTMYGTADNKALEVDIDTGGGAADNLKTIYIVFEYWLET